MCDGLKFESEQGGDPVLQPLLRFPEVWNPTLHALELGSATGLTKGTIIPQKPPPDDNPERLAGRRVLHPPHSTLLLLSGEPANSFPNPIPEEYPVIRPNRWQTLIAFSIPKLSVQLRSNSRAR
jgi:hypothetical protein